jgi:hypothetical protein
MSTTTTAPVTQTAAQAKVVLGTVYNLNNHKKSVEIVYSTDRKGPPETNFIVAATLTYSGPEGQFKFEAPQIQLQDTPMGTLVSVVLITEPIGGNTSLSVFLPPIDFGNNDTEKFTTYLVKTKVIRHPLPETAGPGMTYDVESLSGVAQEVVDQAASN